MRLIALLLLIVAGSPVAAQEPDAILIRPAWVFDGVNPRPHAGWAVLVRGERIEAVGPNLAAPADARVIDLPGTTLMPGMIEGHSHLFLHPYNETAWDAQVLNEPVSLRTARAVNHARATLLAGFTTVRDPRQRGRGLCGRRPSRCDRAGHRARPADAGCNPRSRRDGELRAEGHRSGGRDTRS
jgi:hypothetical protein